MDLPESTLIFLRPLSCSSSVSSGPVRMQRWALGAAVSLVLHRESLQLISVLLQLGQ